MGVEVVEWSLTGACSVVFPLVIIIFFFIKKWKKPKLIDANLPPGPKKLPIIGNLHLVSDLPFRSFQALSEQYGPIMHLKLGEGDTVVVSSPEIAKEMLKDNDPVFANRPQQSIALNLMTYNYTDITFSHYGSYWRQMRKIVTTQLLSAQKVRSFASIRRAEVSRLVDSLRLSAGTGKPVNLTEKVYELMSSVACRAAFGKVCGEKEAFIRLMRETLEIGVGFLVADVFPSSVIAKAVSWRTTRKLMGMRRKMDVIIDGIIHEHQINNANGNANGEFGDEDLVDVLLRIKEGGEMEIPIEYDHIKAMIFEMFTGGTDTASSTLDWVMTELMRNPQAMAKVQAEVRQVMKGRSNTSIEEEDLKQMNYLRLVIMETHRLHPQGSLIPRSSRQHCQISGYSIPEKTNVFLNVWAIHRDPKYWVDPETFKPERFLDQPTMDFTGSDCRYMPFGCGRRVCPGIAFGSASVAFPLAQLLHDFDWKLPHGVDAQTLNMTERFGVLTCRKEKLFVVATPYEPSL